MGYETSGWGVSVGVGFSLGVHLGGGASAEFSEIGKGFSASIGWGASLVPIPYYQTKFGYSWTVLKWNLSNIKNGTSTTKSIFWTKVVKITKQSSYTDIYIFKMNKTIRVFTGTKRIKVF